MNRTAQLRRTVPLRKKRAKPRPLPGARCSYSDRCRRRARVVITPSERMCPTHATWTADKLVGDFVRHRDQRCILASFNALPCFAPQQLYWCHLFPKGTYPSLRYRTANAVAGCAGHHKAFDGRPIEKGRWIVAHLGEELVRALEHEALTERKEDVADVIRRFRGEWP